MTTDTLDFPGVRLSITDDACIMSSEKPLYTLSSAVVGGGFQQTRTIINRHVHINYDCPDPVSDLRIFAAQKEIDEPFVGLLTGVWMHEVTTATLRREELTVASIVTARFSNACAAGCNEPVQRRVGTINIIVLIDGNLEQAAMVNAVMTATEAKTGVLVEAGVHTTEGYQATGTSTDAVVIACTGRGASLPYAGPGTEVGYLIGASVRQALKHTAGIQEINTQNMR